MTGQRDETKEFKRFFITQRNEIMNAFEIYMSKVRTSLKKHFDDNELPPTIEHVLLGKQEILKLYIEGWHPKRTAEFILQKGQENAAAHRKKTIAKICG
jgi:hypothetical protein